MSKIYAENKYIYLYTHIISIYKNTNIYKKREKEINIFYRTFNFKKRKLYKRKIIYLAIGSVGTVQI